MLTSCFSQQPAGERTLIGSTISHYRVLAELGRGGMGVVYRAVDTRLGREVALKFLPDHVAESPTGLTRFRREARAASALNHPNICTIYDIGEHEGHHFIAMELLRGQSLTERLHAGPLPAAEVCRIGAQLAGALEAAHAQGVIHRDVKPGNVFLTERGDAKLLDFGLAKAAPQSDSSETGVTLEPDLTQERRVVGTPSFMSPEQVLGRTVDARSDLFSLGSVLYCMATGRKPFEGPSLHELLESVVRHEPPLVNAVNSKVSAGLAAVVARAMAKGPAMRYASARDLRADLERVDRGETPFPAPTSAARPRFTRKLALVVIAVVLAAVTAAALYVRGRSDADAGRDPPSSGPVIAVLPFSNQTGDTEYDYAGPALGAGLASELAEIGALRVLSPSVTHGSTHDDAVADARAAGTQLLVEGDLLGDGDRLAVTARIVDTRNGLILWTETFDAGASSLLSTQSRIARALAGFTAVPLSRRERQRLDQDPTSSLTAWRLYSEGLRSLDEPTASEGVAHAVEVLGEAIREDPEFAAAHSALARALWSQYEVSKDPAVLASARAAAERAEKIDPDLPDATITQALVSGSVEGDEISPQLTAALARHPRPASAHRELALLYERQGHLDAAERLLNRSVDLDPDDWFNWNWLGVFLFRHRDLPAGERAFARAAELAPSGVTRPRENLAALMAQQGRIEDAIAILESLPNSYSDATVANTLATAYYYSRRPDRLEKAERYYLRAVELEPERALLQGNLEDLYLALGRDSDATLRYRKAMDLAEAEELADPRDGQASLQVALYGAKAGECEVALDRARRLREEKLTSSRGLHELALVFSLCRDRELALETLGLAIEHGFPASFPAQEEEFGWLAEDPEFQRLVRPRTIDQVNGRKNSGSR